MYLTTLVIKYLHNNRDYVLLTDRWTETTVIEGYFKLMFKNLKLFNFVNFVFGHRTTCNLSVSKKAIIKEDSRVKISLILPAFLFSIFIKF